jgi:predicted Fe-Mo cluster-binding NifX family protein
MKVAFPTQDYQGLESPVYGHFGSAMNFVIVETEDQTFTRIVNRDREHAHGQCRPLAALGGEHVDALVVGGIGAGALSKLNAAGIKAYRAVEGSIGENLELLEAGRLPEITLDQTCKGHAGEGSCTH